MEESWRHSMIWILFMGKLSSGLISLPETRDNRTNCISNTLEDNISPYCNYNSKIAIESLRYACLRTSKCPDNATVSAAPSGTLKRAVVRLSGYQQYAYRVTQSLCTKMHTFMRMTYYCIPVSRSLEICTEKNISSQGFVYVTSSDYPYTTLVKETDCNCSISVTNNTVYAAGNTSAVNITMAMIHTELEAGQQLSLMSSDGACLRNLTQHTAQYATSFEEFSYSELDLLWRSRMIGNNGRFWVGFQSSDPNSTVTVSCKKPVKTLTTSILTSTILSTSSHSTISPSTVTTYNSRPSVTGVTTQLYSLYNGTATNKSQPKATTQSFSPIQSSVISNISGTLWSTTSQPPTIHSGSFAKPTKSSGVVPIIAGVVGGILLLLLIIIVIICLVKKKRANKRKVEPELPKTKLQETTQDAVDSSKLTSLPPITGSSLVSEGQSTATPDQLFADDNNHSSAMPKDLAMEEETRQKLNKMKKKKKEKRQIDRVADQDGQSKDFPGQIFADDNNHNAAMVNDMATEEETRKKRRKKKKKRKRRTDRVVDDDFYTADFMENSLFVQDDV